MKPDKIVLTTLAAATGAFLTGGADRSATDFKAQSGSHQEAKADFYAGTKDFILPGKMPSSIAGRGNSIGELQYASIMNDLQMQAGAKLPAPQHNIQIPMVRLPCMPLE